MKSDGCLNLVYFSTDMVYGIPQELPIKTDHPTLPFGPYGKSKLRSEELLKSYWNQGFHISIFRPRMIVGKGRFGLLNKLFWLMKHNLPVAMIGDGKNCYQMVSVQDCADAVICAITHNLPNDCFNLGSENPPSVRDLLQKVIDDVGSKSCLIPTWGYGIKTLLKVMSYFGVELMFEEQYKIADKEYIVDISQTYEKIGWKPRFSDEEMLRMAYEEYSQ